ncbi:hypothetical protein BCR42DRAFT_475153 [Absidia repens]|uniref:RING-type domain-containing protein n=1 Tax=Absidia repens TaxID=90262 RepID=A0A1X2IST9_9FUNG|nr:hypothetical protein BCR42DRAFT_475153 [Absidia repens]
MDDESYGTANEITDGIIYWAERCSICFEATMDISLERCRDQYCHECFQRYVTESVMASWGLGVTTLKCPVCYDPIPRDEWCHLVPQSVVDHYDRFNQPFRSFTRCCPHCEEETKPCDYSLKVIGVK